MHERETRLKKKIHYCVVTDGIICVWCVSRNSITLFEPKYDNFLYMSFNFSYVSEMREKCRSKQKMPLSLAPQVFFNWWKEIWNATNRYLNKYGLIKASLLLCFQYCRYKIVSKFSAAFLPSINPSYAWYSSGEWTTFGHFHRSGIWDSCISSDWFFFGIRFFKHSCGINVDEKCDTW